MISNQNTLYGVKVVLTYGLVKVGEEFLGVCLCKSFARKSSANLINSIILLPLKDSQLSSKPTVGCFPMRKVLFANRNSSVFGFQDSQLVTEKLLLLTESPEI